MKETVSKKIDKLAVAVDALSTTVEAQGVKIDSLGEKVSSLDQKVTRLDQKVSGLDQKVTRLDQKVSGLDQKVSGLDTRTTSLESTMEKVASKLVDMDYYMHTELATKQEVRELRQEMLTNFDAQGVMLQRLDHEFVALRGNTERRLTRVEGHLGFSDT